MRGETWLGDECPHFYAFQKYSLSMRNGADCTWAEGNCLFLWPAAKGEKVNGKWYEIVCLLRRWIRCKLEEEAFQYRALFLILIVLNCFLCFALQHHSCLSHLFLFFLSLFLYFYIFSITTSPRLHCSRVLWVCGLTGWALGGQEGKGRICRLWDRKLRQHGLQWEHSMQQESRGHAESRRTMTLSRGLKKISTQIYWVWTWAHRPQFPVYMCSHWHMVFCWKWIRQCPSWIIVKAPDIAEHHWGINKLVFLSCLPFKIFMSATFHMQPKVLLLITIKTIEWISTCVCVCMCVWLIRLHLSSITSCLILQLFHYTKCPTQSLWDTNLWTICAWNNNSLLTV